MASIFQTLRPSSGLSTTGDWCLPATNSSEWNLSFCCCFWLIRDNVHYTSYTVVWFLRWKGDRPRIVVSRRSKTPTPQEEMVNQYEGQDNAATCSRCFGRSWTWKAGCFYCKSYKPAFDAWGRWLEFLASSTLGSRMALLCNFVVRPRHRRRSIAPGKRCITSQDQTSIWEFGWIGNLETILGGAWEYSALGCQDWGDHSIIHQLEGWCQAKWMWRWKNRARNGREYAVWWLFKDIFADTWCRNPSRRRWYTGL